jgi:pSer/pThr/pTyr-binding forkhead associated (FHA) protein
LAANHAVLAVRIRSLVPARFSACSSHKREVKRFIVHRVGIAMDVILKVTKGSKVGAKIAVKKDEFLIGRSPECHLCAGSTSISRRHCAITRNGTQVTIKDLGSRNGTLVNGEKIEGEIELKSGDEIGIGSLGFLVTISTGIANEKKPQVKSVAEAVERTVEKITGGPVGDEDISGWLIDSDKPKGAFSDTATIRLDDTKASELREAMKEFQAAAEAETTEVGEEQVKPGDSSIDKKGPKGKKEPGKLPPMIKQPGTKDSREAAVEALRTWNRRR